MILKYTIYVSIHWENRFC